MCTESDLLLTGVIALPLTLCACAATVRDWSLITGRGGGLQNGRGGTWSFTPTKRGDGIFFSHSEGGTQKVFG